MMVFNNPQLSTLLLVLAVVQLVYTWMAETGSFPFVAASEKLSQLAPSASCSLVFSNKEKTPDHNRIYKYIKARP
jgi:hypothetical protein